MSIPKSRFGVDPEGGESLPESRLSGAPDSSDQKYNQKKIDDALMRVARFNNIGDNLLALLRMLIMKARRLMPGRPLEEILNEMENGPEAFRTKYLDMQEKEDTSPGAPSGRPFAKPPMRRPSSTRFSAITPEQLRDAVAAAHETVVNNPAPAEETADDGEPTQRISVIISEGREQASEAKATFAEVQRQMAEMGQMLAEPDKEKK